MAVEFFHHTVIPVIPPATVTDADNGLSLNGTIVELGQDVGAVGDPAQLLNDREIPLSGFFVDFLGVNLDFLLDDALNRVKVGSGAFDYFNLDLLNNILTIQNPTDDFTFELNPNGDNNMLFYPNSEFLVYQELPSGNYFSFDQFFNGLGDVTSSMENFDFALNNTSGLVTRKQESKTGNTQATSIYSYLAGVGGKLVIDGEAQLLWTDVPFQTGFITAAGDNGKWKLGKVKAGAVALDAANYVEVEIEGVIVKLLKAA